MVYVTFSIFRIQKLLHIAVIHIAPQQGGKCKSCLIGSLCHARVHTYRDSTNTEFIESKTVSAEVWVGSGSPLLTGKKFLLRLSCRSLEEWGFLFSLLVEKNEMYWPGKSKLRSSSWVFSKSLILSLLSIWIHCNTEKSSTASEVKWSLEMATISM